MLSGREPPRMLVTSEMLEELREELPASRCVVCHGELDIAPVEPQPDDAFIGDGWTCGIGENTGHTGHTGNADTADSEDTEDTDDTSVIRITCEACGNATHLDETTGEEAPARMSVRTDMLDALRDEAARAKCAVCGGPLAIELLR
ncbi:MAG TPA: hypothetical protein VH277_19045 [Gemmatimonadaceae bacterium]|nr:hypothetical protein [Gemmatimonadaceae bacterium]